MKTNNENVSDYEGLILEAREQIAKLIEEVFITIVERSTQFAQDERDVLNIQRLLILNFIFHLIRDYFEISLGWLKKLKKKGLIDLEIEEE